MTVAAISTVAMPRLSDSMEEGVIVSWLVSDGDQVEVGQEIAEVETDKATMPYEAEAAGKIHLRAAEGETVRVGDVIALIGELGTDQSAVSGPPDGRSRQAVAPRSASPHLGTHPAPGDDVGQRTSSNGGGARRNASPVARRLAAELGVDLSALTGSGPGAGSSRPTSKRLPTSLPRRHRHRRSSPTRLSRRAARPRVPQRARVSGKSSAGCRR